MRSYSSILPQSDHNADSLRSWCICYALRCYQRAFLLTSLDRWISTYKLNIACLVPEAFRNPIWTLLMFFSHLLYVLLWKTLVVRFSKLISRCLSHILVLGFFGIVMKVQLIQSSIGLLHTRSLEFLIVHYSEQSSYHSLATVQLFLPFCRETHENYAVIFSILYTLLFCFLFFVLLLIIVSVASFPSSLKITTVSFLVVFYFFALFIYRSAFCFSYLGLTSM